MNDTDCSQVNVTEKAYLTLEREIERLLKALKPDIGDEYRASDDPADNLPGMCVTIGATFHPEDGTITWSYQTGDNSYSGGAYSHAHWGVVYLYRRSNSRQLAHEAVNEIAESIASHS